MVLVLYQLKRRLESPLLNANLVTVYFRLSFNYLYHLEIWFTFSMEDLLLVYVTFMLTTIDGNFNLTDLS